MSNFDADLDVIRRCMLRGSITEDLDAIVTANPVGRCLIVAKALYRACASNPQMEALVNEHGLIDSLKQEAFQRQTGNIYQPALIASDRSKAQKERSNV